LLPGDVGAYNFFDLNIINDSIESFFFGLGCRIKETNRSDMAEKYRTIVLDFANDK